MPNRPPFDWHRFSVDVTIPLDHRCMGILPTKSRKIVDRLFCHGLVLLGREQPVVLAAVDWCEIRNLAYDDWRTALARAAGTSRERVMVCALHQHDAPVTDRGAAELLRKAGLAGELYDEAFHRETITRVATALRLSLPKARPVTHLGLGQARVEQVASNRRVVDPQGRVTFGRGSRSGSAAFHRQAPEGLVDPYLKTLSFWDGDRPLLALHAYATHPMSYYGRGEVTSDFVGLARERRRRDDQSIAQIYVSGCSGDVTAGKYNDGSHDRRMALADRVYQAMRQAWDNTRRVPIEQAVYRHVPLELEFHPRQRLKTPALEARLGDARETVEKRILAAMGLASRRRVESGQPIDLCCLDLGAAQIVLFPGETFVGYQLQTQQLRPQSFVMCIGYGDGWPGYIPTRAAWEDGFDDVWLWVAPGSAQRMNAAVRRLLLPD